MSFQCQIIQNPWPSRTVWKRVNDKPSASYPFTFKITHDLALIIGSPNFKFDLNADVQDWLEGNLRDRYMIREEVVLTEGGIPSTVAPFFYVYHLDFKSMEDLHYFADVWSEPGDGSEVPA